VTPTQIQIIQHALGRDQYGRRTQPHDFRNHYVGGEEECRPLVALGYMTEHKASEITGGDPLFTVTDAGRIAMEKESPVRPKLTRSQLRYREFLDAADAFDCTFREFLTMRTTDWYKKMQASA
jgi:hypothetical protein